MEKIKELVTNKDNRLSTTATIQIGAFVGLTIVLLVSVILDRDYVPELVNTLALYGAGLTVSKGAVSAYREKAGMRD